jgi:predicted glycosyltransferase
LRYLFYTNECVGLGHLRRALNLARAVTDRDPTASALIVTGSPLASDYVLPERVDAITLPLLTRDADGRHRARRLGVSGRRVHEVRSALAAAAAASFAPDVAIVDKTPLGLRGELLPALDGLAEVGCRLVLGLRDIDDEPERVAQGWRLLRAEIEQRYDAVLVYGPQAGTDALACLGWDDLRVPVHHVGYVNTAPSTGTPEGLAEPYVLVTVGGGTDGAPLLHAYLAAIRLLPVPFRSLLVTGPLMPADDAAAVRAAAEGLDAEVLTFRSDMEAVIRNARAVVAMAGYNTVSEIVQAGTPMLLVPRVLPGREQLVRAEQLVAEGVARMLHPDQTDAAQMRVALDDLLSRGPVRPLQPALRGAGDAAEVLHRLATDGIAAVRDLEVTA